jgi:hypothetical protein
VYAALPEAKKFEGAALNTLPAAPAQRYVQAHLFSLEGPCRSIRVIVEIYRLIAPLLGPGKITAVDTTVADRPGVRPVYKSCIIRTENRLFRMVFGNRRCDSPVSAGIRSMFETYTGSKGFGAVRVFQFPPKGPAIAGRKIGLTGFSINEAEGFIQREYRVFSCRL